MQLKLTTDYAVRIILYLARNGRTDSKRLSDNLKISQNYIKKLMSSSNLSQFISSKAGQDGGLELRIPADRITLLDIVKAMENEILITQCLKEESSCDICESFSKEECPIRKCYINIQKTLEEKLAGMKMSSLANDVLDRKGESTCNYSR